MAIHEADQYLQGVPAVEFSLQHSVDPDYGDLWSGQVDVSAASGQPTGSRWGTPGQYVYRLVVTDPNRGRIDWIIDPFAREFGVGKQSAVRLGGLPFAWSPADTAWRVPALQDLAMYEINLAEFHVNLDGAIERLDYLADLGVNCLSIMPVTNIASEVDWGYLPVGYFGVDERFGGNDKFKTFVDAAHARGLAVIVDAVYGHASRALFAYQYLYDQLRYDQNPFMGPFAQNMFSTQGASTDYNRQLTQDFFLAVNMHWLDEFHIDGFRYDCVPNYWDGPTGVGYAKLVYQTRDLVVKQIANGALLRFGTADAPRLIQCAEQLEDPVGILWQSYSDTTWQDGTLGAARAVAHGEDGAIDRLGQALGLSGFPTSVTINGQEFPRTALQYVETHDHPRLLAEFGTIQPDEAGNYLFALGDRNYWYKLQPYLISLLCAKGIPMLWEGEELGEDFTLPENGLGKVALLRPVDWDYFYDTPGRTLTTLTRKLLRLRQQRTDLRQGDYWYYTDPATYQSRGVMIFRRSRDTDTTIIAVNFTDTDATVPFTPPTAGHWAERLNGQASFTATPAQQVQFTIPSNYGRIWTLD